MASPVPPSPTSLSSHYLAQSALAEGLRRALAALWPELDVQDLNGSLPAFKAAAFALTNRFSMASASLASRDYSRRRIAAGVRSSFTVPIAPAPPQEQVDNAVGWATKALWDRALLDSPTSPQAASVLDAAQANIEGAVEKMVLDVGRATTVEAVAKDPKARAWARETKPGCCYFCALMASRGAVYSSARAAGDGNTYHDHCRCTVVPVFGPFEATAHARQWAAEYERLKSTLGHSPSLSDWRQHYDAQAG